MTADVRVLDKNSATQVKKDEEKDVFNLALAMDERCRAFAFLLEAVAEGGNYVTDEELTGIARLAADIAEKATELRNAARPV